ncbi:MAG: hypothetical protein IJW87_04700 [Clostridia bacterium]|nr:hypothetical protein [Clostridia bacterium]
MFDNLTPMADIGAALNITWQGLLAIFVVIGLIIVAVKLTTFITNKIENRKKKKG